MVGSNLCLASLGNMLVRCSCVALDLWRKVRALAHVPVRDGRRDKNQMWSHFLHKTQIQGFTLSDPFANPDDAKRI